MDGARGLIPTLYHVCVGWVVVVVGFCFVLFFT